MYDVLIVDDNPINLKLASSVLRAEGYRVIQAENGKNAKTKMVDNNIDLILMDIGLPDVNGLTLTKELKSDPNTASIPIIVVTASAMKGDDEKAFSAGCDDYIAKPIDTRELPVRVKQILERGK